MRLEPLSPLPNFIPRLGHGRMTPLDGDHYDNVFVHFRLEDDPVTAKFMEEGKLYKRQDMEALHFDRARRKEKKSKRNKLK